MNSLTQNKSLILGSEEAIEKLEQKEKARILVISDSHGAVHSLYKVIREKGPSSDALVICGDSNDDLVTIIQKSAEDDFYGMCLPPVVVFVTGNNDDETYPIINPKIFKNPHAPMYTELKSPLAQVFTAAGTTIFVTHGHRHGLYLGFETVARSAIKAGASLCLFGHTHIAWASKEINDILLLNPGSISRPRNGQPPTFAIININKETGISYDFYEYSESGNLPYSPEAQIRSYL